MLGREASNNSKGVHRDLLRTVRLAGKDDTANGCRDWVRCIQPSADGQAILIALNNVRITLTQSHCVEEPKLIGGYAERLYEQRPHRRVRGQILRTLGPRQHGHLRSFSGVSCHSCPRRPRASESAICTRCHQLTLSACRLIFQRRKVDTWFLAPETTPS